MYSITLKVRELKLLRDNLTGNPDGYDFTDLQVLDHLAKKATALLGDYAAKLAELGREEKAIQRRFRRALSLGARDTINIEMEDLKEELDALNETADLADPLDFVVEDGHLKLIQDKLQPQKWLGLDEIRPIILGMVEAVQKAMKVPDPVLEKAKPGLTLVPKEEASESDTPG